MWTAAMAELVLGLACVVFQILIEKLGEATTD